MKHFETKFALTVLKNSFFGKKLIFVIFYITDDILYTCNTY